MRDKRSWGAVYITLERTIVTSVDISPDRFATLMELAGRCLLRYQRIEHALKLMLPHLNRPGLDLEKSTPNWREFLDSKHTLGPLIERFKEGVNSEQPDVARACLERVVSERNDIVHHFFTFSGALSCTTESLERGISDLERRLANALPLETMLLATVGVFARELGRSIDSDAEEAPSAP